MRWASLLFCPSYEIFGLASPLTFTSPSDLQETVGFARAIGATSLVRIQKQGANQPNPFHSRSTLTRSLYQAAEFHRLPLTEVVIIKDEPASLTVEV